MEECQLVFSRYHPGERVRKIMKQSLVSIFKDCILLRIYNEHIQFLPSMQQYFIYLYSTHYMFRPLMGHLQVLQFSHTPLPNCNANIPIFIDGSYKLVSILLTARQI
jgi:hypothetical protein